MSLRATEQTLIMVQALFTLTTWWKTCSTTCFPVSGARVKQPATPLQICWSAKQLIKCCRTSNSCGPKSLWLLTTSRRQFAKQPNKPSRYVVQKNEHCAWCLHSADTGFNHRATLWSATHSRQTSPTSSRHGAALLVEERHQFVRGRCAKTLDETDRIDLQNCKLLNQGMSVSLSFDLALTRISRI